MTSAPPDLDILNGRSAASGLKHLTFDEPTHTYRMHGAVVPSVTQILESSGISDFSMVPEVALERAKLRGTAVHKACWYDDQDDLSEDSLSDELMGYLAAWRDFRNSQQISILEIEARFYSPLGFAGTFDRLVEMPKWGRAMLDLKTGEEMPSWRIQLAAYARGFFGNLSPGCRRGAVKLRKDGTYSLIWYEMRDMARDWNVFAGALTVWQYRKEHGIL